MLEADINLKWVSTLSGNPKGNPRMPERGMTRFLNKNLIIRIFNFLIILDVNCWKQS